MRTPRAGNTVADALSLLSTVALAAFVVAMLYVARAILIPLALAALLTFLLAPLVSRVERFIGRILAVLVVVTMLFVATGAAGWVLTQQLIDLATKLPDYKVNIVQKLHAFQMPKDRRFRDFFRTVEEVRRELPGATEEAAPPVQKGVPMPTIVAPAAPPENATVMDLMRSIVAPLLGPIGMAALVVLLVICMLLQREDLRRRLIRLVGHGHISATTRALDDAGRRVSRYLLMQLVINATVGMAVAIGLYFLGVPNAFLWGGFSTVLRFIPYVGPWVAATIPTMISLAVSPDWTIPLLTIGLFIAVEVISSNAMEPWLYGTSTGVSPIALIVAAVFWTWMWGPVGLVLATPLTVCLAVLGRHVPQLSFLIVILGDEEALTPAEDCYQRLLTPGDQDEMELVESHMRNQSLTSLYDDVLLPVIVAAETDARRDAIDHGQLLSIEQSVRDILQDLCIRPAPEKSDDDGAVAAPALPLRVLCLPARAERDELGGWMLAHLLQHEGCEAWSVPVSAKAAPAEMLELAGKSEPDVVAVCVVAPSTALHARYICLKIRARFPHVAIVVGLWGTDETTTDSAQRLREAGANAVATSLAGAVESIRPFSPRVIDSMQAAPVLPGDEERVAALNELHLLDGGDDPFLDRITRRMTRIFETPIALVSLVDRDHVWFKSQVGLPDDLAQSRQASRDLSVCGHVLPQDDVMVVEDLARDPRFAANTWLRDHGLRFYAGAPLHAPDAHPIGTLCLFDTRPRTFGTREQRQLREYADEISEEFSRRVAGAPAKAIARAAQ